MPSADTAGTSAAAPPRYYLVAPAGFPNYGDELIAAAWLRHLAQVAPGAEVWVDTHSPGPAAVLLSDLHLRVRFTDTLWRLSGEAPAEDPWRIAAWVQEVVHNPGMMARLHHGIELLAGADVVHVLGGGYVNKVWPHHIGLLAGAAAAVRRSGGRAAMTGQGLLPACDSVTPLLRALADRFEIVDVRDEGSASLLGVPAGVDDAFLGLGPGHYSDADAPEVMLCLQSDLLDGGPGQLAAGVLSILREWKIAPANVGVVEGIPRVDRDVYALFEHELPGARFYPFPDVWAHGLPVAPTQTWISTRFHPHLVAAAGGAAGVAISVRPDYYGAKHRSLTELGSGWTLVEDVEALAAGRVPQRPTGDGFDTELVERLAGAKRQLADAVYAPVVRSAGASEAAERPDPEPPAEPRAGAAPRSKWGRLLGG